MAWCLVKKEQIHEMRQQFSRLDLAMKLTTRSENKDRYFSGTNL
jgi:hypothetical protein